MSKGLAEKKTESPVQAAPQAAPGRRPEAPKGKQHVPLPDTCHAIGCKSKPKRFNFCDDHYDEFKFGLIKKTGEPVPDYEKKFEQYQVYKRRYAQKAA